MGTHPTLFIFIFLFSSFSVHTFIDCPAKLEISKDGLIFSITHNFLFLLPLINLSLWKHHKKLRTPSRLRIRSLVRAWEKPFQHRFKTSPLSLSDFSQKRSPAIFVTLGASCLPSCIEMPRSPSPSSLVKILLKYI